MPGELVVVGAAMEGFADGLVHCAGCRGVAGRVPSRVRLAIDFSEIEIVAFALNIQHVRCRWPPNMCVSCMYLARLAFRRSMELGVRRSQKLWARAAKANLCHTQRHKPGTSIQKSGKFHLQTVHGMCLPRHFLAMALRRFTDIGMCDVGVRHHCRHVGLSLVLACHFDCVVFCHGVWRAFLARFEV